MPATLYALEPEGNRYRFPSVRGHGPLLHSLANSVNGIFQVVHTGGKGKPQMARRAESGSGYGGNAGRFQQPRSELNVVIGYPVLLSMKPWKDGNA